MPLLAARAASPRLSSPWRLRRSGFAQPALWLLLLVSVTLSLAVASWRTSSRASMRAVLIKSPGGPEQLAVGDADMPVLGDTEVLIRVQATAINRADTLQRKGAYNPPPGSSPILGLEATGVIAAMGAGCKGPLKIGDRVIALLAGGGYAEHCSADEGHVMLAPDTLSVQEAAGVAETWLTAFQLLHLVGSVAAGDIVLVHAGGSGVGLAATQLAKHAGARVIVTAGSQAKIDSAMAVGAEAGFIRHDDWATGVLDATAGQGVNLILDCVGGSYWDKNAQLLATEATWVLYGLMGGPKVDGNLLASLLRKRATIRGTTLRARSIAYKRNLVSRFVAEALPQIANGDFKLRIDSVFPMERAGEAHARMEANLNTGKIILTVDESQTCAEVSP